MPPVSVAPLPVPRVRGGWASSWDSLSLALWNTCQSEGQHRPIRGLVRRGNGREGPSQLQRLVGAWVDHHPALDEAKAVGEWRARLGAPEPDLRLVWKREAWKEL